MEERYAYETRTFDDIRQAPGDNLGLIQKSHRQVPRTRSEILYTPGSCKRTMPKQLCWQQIKTLGLQTSPKTSSSFVIRTFVIIITMMIIVIFVMKFFEHLADIVISDRALFGVLGVIL